MRFKRTQAGLTVWCVVLVLGMSASSAVEAAEAGMLREVRALLKLAGEGDASFDEARRGLFALPPAEAIAAIEQTLVDPTTVNSADVRALAYQVLLHHAGENKVAVRQTLIMCLSDPATGVASICCEGLDPEARQSELQARMTELEDSATPAREKQRIIRELARWGECASPALGVVAKILRSRDQDERVRSVAAGAVLDIGGLDGAVGQFKDLDPAAQAPALHNLARYIVDNAGDAHGLNAEDTAALPRTLDFCVNSLGSANVRVRQGAMQALWYAFGYDCYLHRMDDDYGLSKAHREVLDDVAHSDPAPELRQQAVELLAPNLCSRFAKEYQRRAERRERKKDNP